MSGGRKLGPGPRVLFIFFTGGLWLLGGALFSDFLKSSIFFGSGSSFTLGINSRPSFLMSSGRSTGLPTPPYPSTIIGTCPPFFFFNILKRVSASFTVIPNCSASNFFMDDPALL